MKYRAILLDPANPELHIRALQTFGWHLSELERWAKRVLIGGSAVAKVEIYERVENLVNTIEADKKGNPDA